MARGRSPEHARLESDIALCGCKSPDCGTLNEEALELIRDMRERISNLADLLAKSEAMNKKLRRERDSELTADPLYRQACEVLDYWSEKLEPNARELRGGERVRKVLARLHGKPKAYTVEELKRCVDGYALRPYVVDGKRLAQGPPSRRFVEATLVFRDPDHVQKGLQWAAEQEHHQRPIPILRNRVGSLSPLGQTAVRIAEFGWHVFPVLPRSKVPACRNGLLDATCDLDRIIAFWSEHPECNVGIRCGAESDIVVLDVDDGEGTSSLRRLEAQHQPLPATASVVTPRGGSHFYFRHPSSTRGVPQVKNTNAYPAEGLDVRGDGGYVLAPGSVGPNGRSYQVDNETALVDIPEWLLRLLLDRQRTAGAPVDPAEWERIIGHGVREGKRNDQLCRLAGHLFAHNLSAGVVHGILSNTNRERCQPPLPDREVTAIVRSIAKRHAASRAAS